MCEQHKVYYKCKCGHSRYIDISVSDLINELLNCKIEDIIDFSQENNLSISKAEEKIKVLIFYQDTKNINRLKEFTTDIIEELNDE
jgi:hypothetical protein